MQIVIGAQLSYEDVALLIRLRNYLRKRSRKLYMLVRWVLSEHFRAKHNAGYGWHFVFWLSLPPLWFNWQMLLLARWVRMNILGHFVCADCNEWAKGQKYDVGWVSYYGKIRYICHECYDVMYVPDPWDDDAPEVHVSKL